VFVDVGAYIGFYTVYACRRARRVLAVEPNPMALAYLKANVTLNNCHNTIVVPKTVSDKRGVVKLRIPRQARRGHIPTTASIMRSFEEALEVDVEADTLDNIVDDVGLDSVDFIKIDVERAERTLRKARAILIEIWPENSWVFEYLKSLKYKLIMIVDHGTYRNHLLVRS
jgi:FkbM family methyltransferase